MAQVRRALVSVHDTDGLVEFVRALQAMDVDVVAADDTVGFLRDAGLEVQSVEQLLGAKALVGSGPAQTMHPQLSAALQWRGADGDDTGFDLVVVNLAPFERTAGRRDLREEEVLDAIDIEGPGILRAAARNFERVLVVADPEVYPLVLEELEATDGDPGYEARRLLASRAFDATAHYELAVANWFSDAEDFPTYLLRDYVKMADLEYGENPHQRAAYYVEVGARRHLLSMVEQLGGDDLSFNNLADLNVARQVASDFSIPSCVIVKHGSPVGVAAARGGADAFELAFKADEASSYGGVLALNRTVDADAARTIAEHRFDVLFAPGYDDDARAILAERAPDLRVLLDQERRTKSPGEKDLRRVIGGLLVQDHDLELEEREFMDVVTSATPSEQQWGDLVFAYRVSRWVRSNAIVLGKDLVTVGIAGTHASRHDGLANALAKAGDRAKGAMLASDAFLGYDDAVELAINAGIAGIIQPGGSDRDDDIVKLCDDAGIPMVFTHRRHFRH
ncbi:MAG: bifunctional phosphoribosylaminoimidazolecarboxamide formyltransferase/IMP cyclohydrolase [Thermoleophilia bacterium]|nr:bifunctional phosphoribosylaminoimidazolecarboxamide formyltransferase/IMP cyclohydrolase [Thermoleophilia bacterium]